VVAGDGRAAYGHRPWCTEADVLDGRAPDRRRVVSHSPGLEWNLAVALALLVVLAVTASRIGSLRIERDVLIATVRAILQLGAVALVIAAVLDRTWASVLFTLGMFTVAVVTAAGRIKARPDWMWVAAALGAGVVPVLTIIFTLQAAAFTGPAIIPIAGIIIGGTMTAHTLTARRAFEALRADRGQVEAGLALGLPRPSAIRVVIARHAPEAIFPAIDQTRTVGLVTLPGAFVGVLLGGGSAAEAATAQILVLVGLLAAETVEAVVAQRLIADGRILPGDIREALPDR
jgi:putative ABC transport system permease protein